MYEDDIFEDCIEETHVSVSAHLMNKSSINCASFHRGFISAFVAVSNGEVKLLIWKAIDGKRNERKRARDVPLNTALTELDVERVTFVNNNINVECDVDGFLRISVLGCTNDTLFWWEMTATQLDLSDMSLQNYICCDISAQLSKLVFSHNAERCACVDDRSVTVRSDQLKKLRVVTSSASASNSTAIADACFAGPEHSTLVVAYENGLVVGWDVASNDIVLKFNCLRGASKGVDNNPHSAVSGGEPVSLLAVDQYCRIESATPVSMSSTAASGVGSGKTNFFLVVGCRDGRIRLFEMLTNGSSDDGAAMYTHRECNAIDLKRELRFSNQNSGSSNRSGTGVDYASVLEAGTAGSSAGTTATSAISMRQELVMTPLSICFVSAQYALEGAAVGALTAIGSSLSSYASSKTRGPLHSKRPADVSVLNSHLCVVTPRNIVIVNMNIFKVAHNIPLESVGFAAHSIYSAHTGVRLAPRQTDHDQGDVSDGAYAVGHFTADEAGRSISGSEKKKIGGQQETASPVPTAFIDVVLLTSVDKALKVISVPLFSSGSDSGSADNSNNAAENMSINGAARSSRTLGRWKSANDVTADSFASADTHNGAELGALDLDEDEDDGDNDTSEKSAQPRSRVSVFSDPDIPLSLVRMPSLAQHDPSSGRGRSLLDFSIKEAPTPVALKGSAAGFGVKQGGGSERLLCGNWESVAKDKKTGKVLDQPVTFHSKIKSSGYGQAPLDKFAKKRLEEANKRANRSVSAPRQQAGRSAANDQNCNSNSSKRQQGAGIAAGGPRIRKYPVECCPMTQHQPHNNFPAVGVPTSSPIYNIAFSDDATLLGVATADSAVLAARLPVAKNNGDALCYMGHNSRINSISFSHCKPNNQQMLLSCSADGTARVWKGGRVDSAAVIFSHKRHQPGDIVPNIGALTIASSATPQSLSSVAATLKAASNSGKASTMSGASGSTKISSSSRNRPFGENVSAAQFYYMDKFVLLSVKASVLMYSYDTEAADAKNDLKRLLSTGKYKLVTEWDMAASAQNVCALACVNSVQSPVVLCATSDKMLSVLDAAVGSVVRQIESPHDKNIHCIALPQPSVHASLADSEAYNLFATSAIDNVIALWDVRTPRCIARYASHVNKREPVSCCLSPCLRYIATGSEDKTARILDLRTGRELTKLTGHRDVVSSVAFNPLFAQLATGSYDGTVRFYADPLSISQVGM